MYWIIIFFLIFVIQMLLVVVVNFHHLERENLTALNSMVLNLVYHHGCNAKIKRNAKKPNQYILCVGGKDGWGSKYRLFHSDLKYFPRIKIME